MTREQYLEVNAMLTTDIAWMLETWGYDTDDWAEIIMDEIDEGAYDEFGFRVRSQVPDSHEQADRRAGGQGGGGPLSQVD